MHKLKIRRKSHLYFLTFPVKIYIDDQKMEDIDEGVIKSYDLEHNMHKINIKGLVNDIELVIDLTCDSYFEIVQSIDFGMIRIDDPEKIVKSKKNTINWLRYLIFMSIGVSLIVGFIYLLVQLNFNLF